MKLPFGRLQVKHASSDDPLEAATLLYKAAYVEYHDVVEKNAELSLDGLKLSDESQLLEEEAFERLDSARQAMFDASALAHPTIH